ncbi:MAG: sulfur transferase domain-containing protein [Pseudoxanthomonas sp.]
MNKKSLQAPTWSATARSASRFGWLFASALLLAACASRPPATTAAPLELHSPLPDLLAAGQPAPSDWVSLAAQGVTTVINLRPEEEMQGRDEAAEVAAAGMAYVQLPVAGAPDLTPAKAAELRAALAAAPGKVLLHCASANRAGALLALAKAGEGMAPTQALEIGRQAGMRSTEARVREVLALPETPVCAQAPCP